MEAANARHRALKRTVIHVYGHVTTGAQKLAQQSFSRPVPSSPLPPPPPQFLHHKLLYTHNDYPLSLCPHKHPTTTPALTDKPTCGSARPHARRPRAPHAEMQTPVHALWRGHTRRDAQAPVEGAGWQRGPDGGRHKRTRTRGRESRMQTARDRARSHRRESRTADRMSARARTAEQHGGVARVGPAEVPLQEERPQHHLRARRRRRVWCVCACASVCGCATAFGCGTREKLCSRD